MIDELLKANLQDPEFRKQLYAALHEVVGEPVRPVSEYCKALSTWAEIMSENDERFEEMWRSLDISISKSCLLDRLIYCPSGQLRTTPCPKHKGHWSGVWFNQVCECVGPCGCLTGWLPNPDEEPIKFKSVQRKPDGTTEIVVRTHQEAFDNIHKKG